MPDGFEQLALFDCGGVDMARLKVRRDELRVQTRAPRTSKGYAADWRVFAGWCADCGRDPLPASSETVELYCTWLLDTQGRRASTAARHLASISFHHKGAALPSPDFLGARSVVASVCRQRRERPEGKAALTPADLVRAVRGCDAGTNLGWRDRALLVLGFASSLRRSELCGLELADVSFESKGLAVLVRYSKTDQDGRGRLLGVWAGRRALTDPVRVLKAWLARRGNAPGPLFCRVQTGDVITGAGMTGDAVSDAVKRAVARVGLDPAVYGAHSLRAGSVTASAELGRSDQEIMGLSGHGSAKVMKMYVRRARAFSGRNPLAGVL